MDKKLGRKSASTFQSTTLREEIVGTKHVSVSSILMMKHLQRLATWAGGEAGIPPLSALFGNRLAANAEAAGIPLDPSTLLCQRCESILQPGLNCTVRIEKNKNKARRHKEPLIPSQNNVVYTCNVCSHGNLKRGTLKDHMKGLLKVRSNFKKESHFGRQLDQIVQGQIPPKLEYVSELKCKDIVINSPMTPLSKSKNLLEKERKVSRSMASKLQISGNSFATTNSGKGDSGSSKRRRKTWSSLKEIAKICELENRQSISTFAIPFTLQCDERE